MSDGALTVNLVCRPAVQVHLQRLTAPRWGPPAATVDQTWWGTGSLKMHVSKEHACMQCPNPSRHDVNVNTKTRLMVHPAGWSRAQLSRLSTDLAPAFLAISWFAVRGDIVGKPFVGHCTRTRYIPCIPRDPENAHEIIWSRSQPDGRTVPYGTTSVWAYGWRAATAPKRESRGVVRYDVYGVYSSATVESCVPLASK